MLRLPVVLGRRVGQVDDVGDAAGADDIVVADQMTALCVCIAAAAGKEEEEEEEGGCWVTVETEGKVRVAEKVPPAVNPVRQVVHSHNLRDEGSEPLRIDGVPETQQLGELGCCLWVYITKWLVVRVEG